MGKYKKCPRCELNWIPTEEELCEVCKAELGKASKISLLEEDDDLVAGERICPICHVNYLDADEDICAACRAERADKNLKEEDDDSWKDFMDDEEPIEPEDENELSLSQMQDDELDGDEEEEEEECVDDFEEIGEDEINAYSDEDDEDEEAEEE